MTTGETAYPVLASYWHFAFVHTHLNLISGSPNFRLDVPDEFFAIVAVTALPD
jgi:hypothetical protein